MDPVLTGALIWLAQRLLDKGFDRVFDTVFDKQAMVATRRHDLTVEGAQGTSDVDILVRHHLARTRVPVLLTFQKFGTNSGGTTFPMVLGDTASLTLRRDHYVITALIVDLPRTAGAKPTLRGLGWSHQWVADNRVKKITIATQHPTSDVMRTLGLEKADGNCPFVLPVATPPPVLTDWHKKFLEQHRTLHEQAVNRTRAPRPAPAPPRLRWEPASPVTPAFTPPPSPVPLGRMCHARAGLSDRCQKRISNDMLCTEHWRKANNGHPVYDYRTGDRLWTS